MGNFNKSTIALISLLLLFCVALLALLAELLFILRERHLPTRPKSDLDEPSSKQSLGDFLDWKTCGPVPSIAGRVSDGGERFDPPWGGLYPIAEEGENWSGSEELPERVAGLGKESSPFTSPSNSSPFYTPSASPARLAVEGSAKLAPDTESAKL